MKRISPNSSYHLKVQVINGTTNPEIRCDAVFQDGENGLLLNGNFPLFIGADLQAAGIPASSVNRKAYWEIDADVLQHALRITDNRVHWDRDKHPRLAAALDGDIDALNKSQWDARERKRENAFLATKGYHWEQRSFYVGGEIADVVTRNFLIDAAGEAVIGCKPAAFGIATFGNLHRLLTELGYYGVDALNAMRAADAREAEQRRLRGIIDDANLHWSNDAGEAMPVPKHVKCTQAFRGRRTMYGVEGTKHLWVRLYNGADGDNWDLNNDGMFMSFRFPYDAEVAAAIEALQ